MRVPTVIIETDNGPVVINKTAFDPATMTLVTTDTAVVAPAAPVVEPAAPVVEPAAPVVEPAAPVQMAVIKKGKKILVVDVTGKPVERDGIAKGGYDSEADAWAAIMAVSNG